MLGFIFSLAGSAVLLDNSARDSNFQPRIRESMRRLIMNAHHDESRQTLAMIQENVSHVIYFGFVYTILKFAYFCRACLLMLKKVLEEMVFYVNMLGSMYISFSSYP